MENNGLYTGSKIVSQSYRVLTSGMIKGENLRYVASMDVLF